MAVFSYVDPAELYQWCKVPVGELEHNPRLKVPFRLVDDSAAMGRLMAKEIIDMIERANEEGREFRAIIPCGPAAWEKPFVAMVNERRVSLKHFVVYHMDECLDWQGRELDPENPYSFRGHMTREWYEPVDESLRVPEENRHWLNPHTYEDISQELIENPVELAYGGWGQDGHLAYNQSRRQAYSKVSFEQFADSRARIQDNNDDTIMALAQRTFGSAYEFVPPMSVTLGMKEILSAKKVRVFSDTGAWKQTALRVALFGSPTAEYPMTALQFHKDALITATRETAAHPISLHPEWRLGF